MKGSYLRSGEDRENVTEVIEEEGMLGKGHGRLLCLGEGGVVQVGDRMLSATSRKQKEENQCQGCLRLSTSQGAGTLTSFPASKRWDTMCKYQSLHRRLSVFPAVLSSQPV